MGDPRFNTGVEDRLFVGHLDRLAGPDELDGILGHTRRSRTAVKCLFVDPERLTSGPSPNPV